MAPPSMKLQKSKTKIIVYRLSSVVKYPMNPDLKVQQVECQHCAKLSRYERSSKKNHGFGERKNRGLIH